MSDPETHRARDPRVDALEEKRIAAGVSVYAMRKRAGVSSSTFYDWMKGAEPKRATLERCEAALVELAAKRQGAADE